MQSAPLLFPHRTQLRPQFAGSLNDKPKGTSQALAETQPEARPSAPSAVLFAQGHSVAFLVQQEVGCPCEDSSLAAIASVPSEPPHSALAMHLLGKQMATPPPAAQTRNFPFLLHNPHPPTLYPSSLLRVSGFRLFSLLQRAPPGAATMTHLRPPRLSPAVTPSRHFLKGQADTLLPRALL